MQDDSMGGRDELLTRMREMARQNESSMRSCSYRHPGKGWGDGDQPQERAERGSTFGLRLLLCLVIWGGFFWMHMENAPIMGYQTEKVVEAVSTDVGLQELKNSVTIKP